MLVLPSPSSTESSSASQGGHNCRKGHLDPLASGRNAEPSVPPAASEHRGHSHPPAQDPPKTPPPNLPPRAASHRFPPPTKGSISQDPPPQLPRPLTKGSISQELHPPTPKGSISQDHHPYLPPGQHLTGPPPPPPTRAASRWTTTPTSYQGSISQELHLPIQGQHLTGPSSSTSHQGSISQDPPRPQSPPKDSISQAPCDRNSTPSLWVQRGNRGLFFPPFLTARGFPHKPSVF